MQLSLKKKKKYRNFARLFSLQFNSLQIDDLNIDFLLITKN